MLSAEEIASLDDSQGSVMKMFRHLDAKSDVTVQNMAQLRSDFGTLEANINRKTDGVVDELAKIRNDFSKLSASTSECTKEIEDKVIRNKSEVDRALAEHKAAINEHDEQLQAIRDWQRQHEAAAGPSKLRDGLRSANRKRVDEKRLELHLKVQGEEAERLKSRIVIGSKVSTVVGSKKTPVPLDFGKCSTVVDAILPGAKFVTTKLTQSLVAVQFTAHPDGMSAKDCAAFVARNYVEIGVMLNAWVKLDQPAAMREARRRALKFANFYKRRATSAIDPFYRFVKDHLLMDELVVCPEILVPPEEYWEEFAGVLDQALDSDFEAYDGKDNLQSLYVNKVIAFLTECKHSKRPKHTNDDYVGLLQNQLGADVIPEVPNPHVERADGRSPIPGGSTGTYGHQQQDESNREGQGQADARAGGNSRVVMVSQPDSAMQRADGNDRWHQRKDKQTKGSFVPLSDDSRMSET